MTTYLVTGASGQLGSLVVDHLAKLVPVSDIVALVRSDKAAQAFADKGIATRRGDYTDPAALEAAFQGIDRILLISSSEVGQRVPQHRNAINAAKAAGVGFVAYTSILNADRGGLALAAEHIETEAMLRDSGISHTLLRNGWYSENITMTLQQDLALGQHFGAAADGRLAAATRHDFAEAAAIVLAGGHDSEVLELAGDDAFSLTEYAELVSQIAGKTVVYTDMPETAFAQALAGAGIPETFAAILADTDAHLTAGALVNDSHTLSRLIGRPTTPIHDTIKQALA